MTRGHLKIFFSYAEGIGKTEAMLKAALSAKLQGTKVMAGYIAPHFDAELADLPEFDEAWNLAGEQLDTDRVLSAKPQLVLVDELAHTNPKGSRHRFRYQDVEELLQAGIDVYTTLNIGNIESLHDTVASITGVSAWERIPDFVFDQADQVELIDIEPAEVLKRIHEKKITDAPATEGQLTALREIALRRCADRVRRLSEQQKDPGFHTDEHILVCLSSAPSNARIIRTAARMAQAFNSRFTALFVEHPAFAAQSKENKKRLRENQKLAADLGASIETVYGEDIAFQIAEFARLSGVTKIVLGRSEAVGRRLFSKPLLTDQLLSYAPEMDIHIIPDKNAAPYYAAKRMPGKTGVLRNIAVSIAILAAATLLSLLFHQFGFTDSNIIMVYILGVLVTSVMTSDMVYSLVSSVASVFIFNYLFTIPRFSLTAYGTGYPVTFIVMFLTAYLTGTYAIRVKQQGAQAARLGYRTKVLLDTSQLLSKAEEREEIIEAAAGQIRKLCARGVVFFENEDGKLSAPAVFPYGEQPEFRMQEELKAAQWVLENNHNAGAATDTFSESAYDYFAVRVNENVYGVAGIEAREEPIDAFEHGILTSILGETALALENKRIEAEKEAAAVMAEREQLRANLLRMISHDLRTPLTTISGNAANLLNSADHFDADTRKQIYSDIYDDSMWLTELVENLLYATRIEEGRMTLNRSPELVSDMIDEALRHIGHKASGYRIVKDYEEELLVVKADARLVIQVITNLIDNALKYTPKGSTIRISASRVEDTACVKVADNGPGIPDEEKEKVFEKFYSGHNKIGDNRRSSGLGLFLCRAIIEAHGGTINVTDQEPSGSVFRFTLPLQEVKGYEQDAGTGSGR